MGWDEPRVYTTGELMDMSMDMGEGGGKINVGSIMTKFQQAYKKKMDQDVMDLFLGNVKFPSDCNTLTNSAANYTYTGPPNTTNPSGEVNWSDLYQIEHTGIDPDVSAKVKQWTDSGTNGTWHGNSTDSTLPGNVLPGNVVIGPGTIPLVYDDPPIQNPPLPWTGIDIHPTVECDHEDLVDDMVEMQEQWIGAMDALKKKAEDLAKCVEILFNQVESDKLSQTELNDLATVARLKALNLLGGKLSKAQKEAAYGFVA